MNSGSETASNSHRLSRPLRQPLSRGNSVPEYGKITLRHPNAGGSLPIFPSQKKDTTERDLSAKSVIGNTRSFHSAEANLFSARDVTTTKLPKVSKADRKAAKEARKEARSSKSKSDASKKTRSKKEIPAEPPLVEEPELSGTPEPEGVRYGGPKSRRFVFDETTSGPQKSQRFAFERSKKDGVEFDRVEVCYFEEEDRPMLVVGLDQYERQRGPTRPPRFFLKSDAELRQNRMLRQIEDTRADEEWRAIREAESVIRADFENVENGAESEGPSVYADLAKKMEMEDKKPETGVFSRLFRGKRSNPLRPNQQQLIQGM